MLSQKWPTLRRYWPNLQRVSAPQAAFLTLDTEEAFYGGAAGGGKSDALLAAALQYVDVPGYAALIVRQTYADLSLPGAAMTRANEWLGGHAHWSEATKTWTFPSNATLTFGYLEHEDDRFRYKSSEFAFIGFDELTQFTELPYTYLFSRLRTTDDVPVPLRMRSASNPGDVGHGWVKKRFISQRKPGVIFVPAKLEDHPDERFKTGYRVSLSKLDETTRRQMEDGDWDVAAGLAFPNFNRHIHVIEDFQPPDTWDRFESMDFGVANPTCVLAWAADYDGNLIIFDSYYSDRNTLVSEQARAIKAKREWWWPRTPAGPTLQTIVCHADPSMWASHSGQTKWGEAASDVTELLAHGIDGLAQANNKRRPGRLRLLELLKTDAERAFPAWHPRAGQFGAPRLFIAGDRCEELVEQLGAAPTNPKPENQHGIGEVVKGSWESAEGHAIAAARYGGMAWATASDEPQDEDEDPRAALMRKVDEAREVPQRRVYA